MDRLYNVLFLCTGNSARSILAEAVLNRMGRVASELSAFNAMRGQRLHFRIEAEDPERRPMLTLPFGAAIAAGGSLSLTVER